MRTSVRPVTGAAAQASPLAPAPVPAAANGRGVRKTMDVELNRLRSMFKEIVENYAAKIEGEIAQVCEEVREQEGEDCEEALQAMLTCLRQIKVKPEKGRLRDLKRIHELVKEMRSLVEAW